jgi:hypothetical protein
MAAWHIKEGRQIDTGRVVTLEYEGRDLVVHIQEGRDFDAVVGDYGQRLVEIVEGAKKEADCQANWLAEVHAGAPEPKQPCGCMEKINRTKDGKTLGVVSLGKALLGGAALPEIATRRLAICQACQATDPTGARLYRVIDGRAYCGVPRLADMSKVYRDEREWGCGCELAWKAGLVAAGCPLGQW